MEQIGHYWHLIFYKAYADLRAESEKMYLSYLWWIIEPLLNMGVYYLVFGILFHRGTEDYIAFLLTGLVIWRWLTQSITEAASSLISGQNLMRQVYVPKFVFPTVTVLNQTFKFTIVFCILCIFLNATGKTISWAYLFLPLYFAAQLILILGAGYFLSAIFPFFPDLRLALNTFFRIAFFVSGIFFEGSSIPEAYRPYFYLNPLAGLFEGYRAILLYGKIPDMSVIWILTALGIAMITAGHLLLKKFDRKYPKILK